MGAGSAGGDGFVGVDGGVGAGVSTGGVTGGVPELGGGEDAPGLAAEVSLLDPPPPHAVTTVLAAAMRAKCRRLIERAMDRISCGFRCVIPVTP